MRDKSAVRTCELDHLLSSLLAARTHWWSPVLYFSYNDSLLTGSFPSVFKYAFVRPLLRNIKNILGTKTLNVYSLVSSLPFLSKLTENIALLQLSQHLQSNNLFYSLQSTYRSGHSTETAFFQIVNDLLTALDVWYASIFLCSLYLIYPPLLTHDHSILLSRLSIIRPDITILADWAQSIKLCTPSYFRHFWHCCVLVSVIPLWQNSRCLCQWCFLRLNVGFHQGSVLGPILFVLYTHPISEVVSYHSLTHHGFSDDNQLYKSGNISQLFEIIHSAQSCISDVKAWVTNNQLQLNNAKTEMILIATKTILNSECVPQLINLEGSGIKLANTVRNLSVCPDTSRSFQQQIPSVCRICCLELRQTSAVRHYLSEGVTKTIFYALVLWRLNYCNSLLTGCPKYLLSKLKKGKEQCCQTHFQNTQIRPCHSYVLFSSLATYWAKDRIQVVFALL